MRSPLLALGAGLFASVGLLAAQEAAPPLPAAPANPPAPSVQAPNDPGYAVVIAACKTPPPARGRGGGGRGGAAGGRGPAPAGRGGAPQGPREYTVAGIPDVIAAGQRWRFLWQEAGNNGDGILGADDGGLLLAQNDNSRVVKLDASGRPSVVHSDTNTGGALSRSAKGALFIASRGLGTALLQLEPRRQVLANRYQGEPLECIGGVLNDLTADARGGVYFTMGAVYYASPAGVVSRYGEVATPNGIILSGDEKTLYVTNGPVLAAFDVQPDGALTNQREFGRLEGGGGGDGLAIDAAGRVYVTSQPGVQVLAPDGKYLGIVPTPRPVISAAFGGKDRKTLFVLARGARDAAGAEVANAAQVYAIPLLAEGFRGRAK